jgi:2'-5' RNA ligase
LRLFIAINFDGETLGNLLALQKKLAELGRGNFSRVENLHLTLGVSGRGCACAGLYGQGGNGLHGD